MFEYTLHTSDKCIITWMSRTIIVFRIEIRENGGVLRRSSMSQRYSDGPEWSKKPTPSRMAKAANIAFSGGNGCVIDVGKQR